MKRYKNDLKKMILFLTINTLIIYISAYFIVDTGSGMLILISSIPMMLLISSAIFGGTTGLKAINFLYPILTGLIFLPSVYIFYNSSALIYVPAYGIIALIGMLIGGIFYKNKI